MNKRQAFESQDFFKKLYFFIYWYIFYSLRFLPPPLDPAVTSHQRCKKCSTLLVEEPSSTHIAALRMLKIFCTQPNNYGQNFNIFLRGRWRYSAFIRSHFSR